MAGDLTVEGLDAVTAQLKKVGDSQALIDDAMKAHGETVRAEAIRTAPKRTGAMANAVTSTYTPGTLTVDAGQAKVPYAYTFHAVALGTSNGYMTFRLPSFTRRGARVKAHGMVRPIPNKPYLYLAWQQKESELFTAVEDALTKAVTS